MVFHIEHHDSEVAQWATRIARDPSKATEAISEVRSLLLKDAGYGKLKEMFVLLDALEASIVNPLKLSELSVDSRSDLPITDRYDGEPGINSGTLVEAEFWDALTEAVFQVNREIAPVGAIWMPSAASLLRMRYPEPKELSRTQGKFCRTCTAKLGTGVRVIGHTAENCPVHVHPWKTNNGHLCSQPKMITYLLGLEEEHNVKVERMERKAAEVSE